MRRVELGAVAALAAALLAGCVQPAEPTPSASPTPTYLCTPEAGGDEAPCSEADYQKMKEKDALYAEAEQVYRKYQAEFLKVIRRGGGSRLSKGLKSVIGHPDVEAVVLSELRAFKDQGLRIKGPGARIVDAIRKPSRTKNGSSVAMEFCVDSRRTKVFESGKTRGTPGILASEMAYFATVEDAMRIVAISGQEVDKCTE